MQRSGLVDFHCHLDLYPDYEAAVRRCESDGVYTLTVTTTPKAWARNYELTKNTRHVRSALGLHPQLVAERAAELPLWEELLPQARYVGEVGLDAGPRFYRSFELQKSIFSKILAACALAGDKVLTVHSVRATKAVLDLVEAHLPASRGRVVLHWFTGTMSEARRAVDMGCFFSVNAEMLGDEKRSRLVASLPQDRILTETDGPFTHTDGKPNEPRDVATCVAGLARLLRRDEADMAGMVRANLRALLGEI